MAELNFCPFCDAPRHKVVGMPEGSHFCKECGNFFTLHEVKFTCMKCRSVRFEASDFPTPDGELVLQCRKCKKLFSVSEFLEKNERVS